MKKTAGPYRPQISYVPHKNRWDARCIHTDYPGEYHRSNQWYFTKTMAIHNARLLARQYNRKFRIDQKRNAKKQIDWTDV